MENGILKNKQFNICVVGGGNMGALIASELSVKKNVKVSLLATKANQFNGNLIVEDWDLNKTYQSGPITIADKPNKIVNEADILLITVPANVIKEKILNIYNFIKENTIIGFIPGSGGVEFFTKKFIKEKNCQIFGLQRVHALGRFKEYGKIVMNKSTKKEITVGGINFNNKEELKGLAEFLFGVKVKITKSYLSITFSPSNQILHTTRLSVLFKDYCQGKEYEHVSYFYKDWDIKSSDVLIACDNELHLLCRSLYDFDLSDVVPLLTHYESNNSKELTQKLQSIPAFKISMTPMIKTESGKFVPDLNYRYFTADFPYGICLIKGFAELMGHKTPHIDKVIRWYEKVANVEYFNKKGEYKGKDLIHTSAPQNFGIDSKDKILEFYNN